MNLADEHLKELDGLLLGPADGALVRCRASADLVSKGQYEAACGVLGALWRGVGRRPEVEGLDGRVAAEVLLQVGALSGWIGASRQDRDAQAAAKDLISEGASLFEALGEAERAGAARSELALCYWREGAYDEARVLLTTALGALTETTARAKAILRLNIVEFWSGRYGDALAILKDNAHIFDERVSHSLRGNFHNELALVLKQLGTLERRPDYLDRAIIEYTASIYHYEQSGHERYRAANENNLASLLRKMGRYPQAHEHLDRAESVTRRLGDAGLLASFEETRARVLIDEKKYVEAERVIARAVQSLEAGSAAALLAEALTTQGMVWARLGRNDDSISVLRRASKVGEEAGALCNAGLAALTLIEEHGTRRALSPGELYDCYLHADVLLRETQHAESAERLRDCARIVMRRLAGTQLGDENFTLFGAVHELEARLIGQALDEAGGSVTRAAKVLGLRHQTFLSMLNTRHRRLLEKRTPPEKRLKSIIKVVKDGRRPLK
jgi:tetratricopeptide (TPR) repeat protein